MLSNLNKYRYYKSKRKPINWFLIIIIIAVIIIIFFIFFLFILNNNKEIEITDPESEQSLFELWNGGLYSEVISKSKQILINKPVDRDTLMYSGFSYYYLAYYEESLEDKINLINSAIINIRRAKLSKNLAYIAETDYILGKAYIEKEVIIENGQRKYSGKYYPDLAIQYLENSINLGYVGKDTYEYLGLAYDAMENYEKVIESFKKAYELDNLDKYTLAIGKAYLQLEDFNNSEIYLLKTLSESVTSDTEKECRFSLAEIYLYKNELDDAKEQFLAIIELDPYSAVAHFQLGEIYFSQNDIVQARSEYRKTLRIDPNHYGARLRYYK